MGLDIKYLYNSLQKNKTVTIPWNKDIVAADILNNNKFKYIALLAPVVAPTKGVTGTWEVMDQNQFLKMLKDFLPTDQVKELGKMFVGGIWEGVKEIIFIPMCEGFKVTLLSVLGGIDSIAYPLCLGMCLIGLTYKMLDRYNPGIGERIMAKSIILYPTIKIVYSVASIYLGVSKP